MSTKGKQSTKRDFLKQSTNDFETDNKESKLLTKTKDQFTKEDGVSLLQLLMDCEDKFDKLGNGPILNISDDKDATNEHKVAELKLIIDHLENYANLTYETIIILRKIVEYHNRYKVIENGAKSNGVEDK